MKIKKVVFLKTLIGFFANKILWFVTIVVFLFLNIFFTQIKKVTSLTMNILNINITNAIVSGVVVELIIIALTICVKIIINNGKITTSVKRFIYTKLLNIYKHTRKRLIEKLIEGFINIFFKYEKLTLNEQENIISAILENLKKENKSSIFWIIGEAYSGKTTTALNLLTELIFNPNYIHLFEVMENKIYYLDLGNADFKYNDFIKNYDDGAYFENLIILDNIHKIPESACFSILNKIVGVKPKAFATIILSRAPEDFLSRRDKVDDLLSKMNEHGTCLELAPIPNTDIKSNIANAYIDYHQFEDFCQKIDPYFFSSSMMHILAVFYSQVFLSYKKHLNEFVFMVFDLINNRLINQNLLHVLTCIICNSIFTGSFSKKQFNNSIKIFKDNKLSYKYLNMLIDIGFVNHFISPMHNYYIFHEEIAKHYFTKLKDIQQFKEYYNDIAKYLYEYNLKASNHVLAWLYSLTIKDKLENATNLFDIIVLNANYKNLLRELEYMISSLCAREELFHRELGILYDRTGNIKKAGYHYEKYYYLEKEPKALINLVQVNHNIFFRFKDEFENYCNSTNHYINIAANYWTLHINMHDGNFNFSRFQSLEAYWDKYLEEILSAEPYDGFHLLRRWYFDYFRIYYLQGVLNYSKLKIIKNSKIRERLSSVLNEFPAYFNKFVKGHYVHYDIMFMLGIFKKIPLIEELTNIFGYEKEFDNNKSDIKFWVARAESYYFDAYNALKKVGDKSFYYSKNRYYETKLADDRRNYLEVKGGFEEYLAFSKSTEDDELIAYAYTYLLKYYLVEGLSEAYLLESSEIVFPNDKNIRNSISMIKYHYDQYDKDKEQKNIYARVRLELYEILYNYQTKNHRKDSLKHKLSNIYKVCQQKGYNREVLLIDFIKEKEYSLSPSDLRDIYRYYPIVNQ